MALPEGSDLNKLTINNEGGYNFFTGKISSYESAQNLVAIIDTFDKNQYNSQTQEASQLLQDRQKDRQNSPACYPDIKDLCPKLIMYNDKKIEIVQKDYITSTKPFCYISKSIEDLISLRSKLPEFAQSIGYIDAECSQSGVYSTGSLCLQKGFEISTQGTFVTLGEGPLQDYNLVINAGNFFNLGGSIHAMRLQATVDCFYNGKLDTTKKPERMSQEVWNDLTRYLLGIGVLRVVNNGANG